MSAVAVYGPEPERIARLLSSPVQIAPVNDKSLVGLLHYSEHVGIVERSDGIDRPRVQVNDAEIQATFDGH